MLSIPHMLDSGGFNKGNPWKSLRIPHLISGGSNKEYPWIRKQGLEGTPCWTPLNPSGGVSSSSSKGFPCWTLLNPACVGYSRPFFLDPRVLQQGVPLDLGRRVLRMPPLLNPDGGVLVRPNKEYPWI